MLSVGGTFVNFVISEIFGCNVAVVRCNSFDCASDAPVVSVRFWVDVFVEYLYAVTDVELVVGLMGLLVVSLRAIFCCRTMTVWCCRCVGLPVLWSCFAARGVFRHRYVGKEKCSGVGVKVGRSGMLS